MAEDPIGWQRFPGHYDKGVRTTELSSWGKYEQFIREQMLDYRQYVWRGHASEGWLLEPTLDRNLRKIGKPAHASIRASHLKRFKYATRGRRGTNPPNLQSDNDWWALGQHNGLATPLLDWTRSPYVAAYFAFYPENPAPGSRRAIFGISRTWVNRKSDEIISTWKEKSSPPVVEFFEPLTDDNPRLVNQSGLFSRAPDGIDLEDWVKRYSDDGTSKHRLHKILLPDNQRSVALRSLNRMNINHLSLFPDIYGASKFVNLDLMIDKY